MRHILIFHNIHYATIGCVARRILCLGIACLLLLLLPTGPAQSGEIRTETFHSTALGRNIAYTIYLPSQHDNRNDLDYPVLFLLHGLGGNEKDWLNLGKVSETLDRLIGSGAIPPIVVVMPDAANSWYVDSTETAGFGDFETAIGDELPAHIGRRYPVRRDRDGRAIAGLSMGGYGALRLGFARPDRFAGIVSLSGAIFPDQDRNDALSNQQYRFFKGVFGTPFSHKKFNENNMFENVFHLREATDPPKVYLMVGDHDGFGLYQGTLSLFLLLREAGLPVELRVRDGDHQWSLWRQEMAHVLPWLAQEVFVPSEGNR